MKYWESIFQMSHTLSPSLIVSASGDRWRTNKENGITSLRLPCNLQAGPMQHCTPISFKDQGQKKLQKLLKMLELLKQV
jgi:hypothetical protein